jgi:hypothetical protein
MLTAEPSAPDAIEAARATLDLNNRDAWRAMLERLQAAGIASAEAQAMRNAAWAERKRLRVAARAERAAMKGT